MKQEFIELYKKMKEKIEDENAILIEKIKEKPTLDNVDCLSVHFSSCLCEDIDFILELLELKARNRYVYSVIRNVCEQVIEYKYLCKHNEYIKEFYGKNIQKKYLDSTTDIKRLKALMGEGRYSTQQTVRERAHDIGEDDDSDENDDMSLYTIYQISSTEYHQSYFNEILDLISEMEAEKKGDDEEIIFIMLTFLFTKFMNSYNECVGV